jgi:hypothetical protein
LYKNNYKNGTLVNSRIKTVSILTKDVFHVNTRLLPQTLPLNFLTSLGHKVKNQEFKTRYVNSKSYAKDIDATDLRHSNPYLFCHKLKTEPKLNFNGRDYIGQILSQHLDNPKLNATQKNLTNLESKLRKKVNLR